MDNFVGWFESLNPQVREQANILAAELYLWIGDALIPFVDKLRTAQQTTIKKIT